MKNDVSTSTPRTMPARAEPDHAPVVALVGHVAPPPRLPAVHPLAALGVLAFAPHRRRAAMIRRSFGAKNSSLAATTAPPRRSEARSTRSTNEPRSQQPSAVGAREPASCPRRVRRARTSCRSRAAERAAGVRRQLVALLQPRRIDDAAPRPDPTRRDRHRSPARSGPCGAPSPASAAGAALIQRASQRQRVLARLALRRESGPGRRERQLERRDPAPRRDEIADPPGRFSAGGAGE